MYRVYLDTAFFGAVMAHTSSQSLKSAAGTARASSSDGRRDATWTGFRATRCSNKRFVLWLSVSAAMFSSGSSVELDAVSTSTPVLVPSYTLCF